MGESMVEPLFGGALGGANGDLLFVIRICYDYDVSHSDWLFRDVL